MNTSNPPKTNKYYFYSEATKIIYFSDELPEDSQQLVYLGTSDNKDPKKAAAAFTRNNKVTSGYRVRPHP